MSAVFAPNLAELECFRRARFNLVRRAEINAEAVAIRAEQLRSYRFALQDMPWNFEMEDDQGRWRDGVAALATLHDLQAQIDPLGVIWHEHLRSIGRTTPGPRVGVFSL